MFDYAWTYYFYALGVIVMLEIKKKGSLRKIIIRFHSQFLIAILTVLFSWAFSYTLHHRLHTKTGSKTLYKNKKKFPSKSDSSPIFHAPWYDLTRRQGNFQAFRLFFTACKLHRFFFLQTYKLARRVMEWETSRAPLVIDGDPFLILELLFF